MLLIIIIDRLKDSPAGIKFYIVRQHGSGDSDKQGFSLAVRADGMIFTSA